eukprot:GILI01024336.1.p1 GENE.GILI01024336.1~~GILI01024336.1.p1  ORF type:complete len:333 (-),score=69.23 GILI01024336.1:31-1029(-)
MEQNNIVPEDANEGCPGVASEVAGKSSACAGCPNQQICASGKAMEPDPAIAEVKSKLSTVKHKVLVLSGKGGVGKSTISSQLAFGLAHRDKEVGLLDIDICGPSIPRMLGLEGQEVHQSMEGWSPVYVEDNLGVMSIGFLLPNQDDAVIWRGPRKNGLIKQFLTDVTWGDLDYLVVDAPPGTSDEHISIVQYLKPSEFDGAVIVTTPQEVSLADVRKEINFCKKTNLRILGVVENMSGFVCPNCSHESHIFPPVSGGAKAMCEKMDVPFLGRVPLDPNLLLSCEAGKSYVQQNPASQCAIALNSVVDGVLKALQSDNPAPAAAVAVATDISE